MSWFDDARKLGVLPIAEALGLAAVGRGHLESCPACGEGTRSRSDGRSGAVFLAHGGRGWSCGRCQARGGGLELASLVVLGGRKPESREDWLAVHDALVQAGLLLAERPGQREPGWWIRQPPARPLPVYDRPRPAPETVEALWSACVSVADDEGVAAWARSRGLAPEAIGAHVARALPADVDLPAWAVARGGADWHAGWRLVLPAWDWQGRMASLRARWVRPEPPPAGAPKTVAPAAGEGTGTGLVYADELVREVLATGRPPRWWSGPLTVVVTEGDPDFLTWATAIRGLGGDPLAAPGQLGVWSGSLQVELLDRLPFGSTLISRIHRDDAGRRYEQKLAELAGRRLKIIVRGA